jgi:hypothetical protein
MLFKTISMLYTAQTLAAALVAREGAAAAAAAAGAARGTTTAAWYSQHGRPAAIACRHSQHN